MTAIHEINQNKLDCQVPDQERQWVDRSDQFAESVETMATEQLMERVRRLERSNQERCTNRSRGWSVALQHRTQQSVETCIGLSRGER